MDDRPDACVSGCLVFNCENRLMDVNNQNDNPVASYSYDYLGRRVSKTVYGSPDVTTEYCYDGDQMTAGYQDGSRMGYFVYVAGIDEPVYKKFGGIAGGLYYHFDGLGSVVALSMAGSGDILERYSYDVFVAPNRTSSLGNPYLFTGRRYDNETGLYYYRARYYNPDIGRFMQTGPIGYVEGLNLHTYVSNNPVNRVDPRGLGVWSCIRNTLRSSRVHTTIDVIGVIILYAACVGGCGTVTGARASMAAWQLLSEDTQQD